MSRTIDAKVNAVYDSVVYLNIGKQDSVKGLTSNFKSLPMVGEVIQLEGYSEFEMKGRKGTFATFSNCKFLQRVEAGKQIPESNEKTAPIEPIEVPF